MQKFVVQGIIMTLLLATAVCFGQMTIKNSGGTTIMSVTQDGSMAVGKATLPSDKLDVSGNIRSSAKTTTQTLQVTGGGPGAGEVLSATNTSGDATWTSLAGDVSGPANNLRVTGLQTIPVSNAIPAPGNVLKYGSGGWAPANALNYVTLDPINKIRDISDGVPDATYTKANLGIPSDAKAVHIVYGYWKDNAKTRTFIQVNGQDIDSQWAYNGIYPIEHKSAIIPFLNNVSSLTVWGDGGTDAYPSCLACGCEKPTKGYFYVLGYFF